MVTGVGSSNWLYPDWYTKPNAPVDAYGNWVPDTQAQYVYMIQTNPYGASNLIMKDNPNYKGSTGTGATAANPPPQYQATFDTIGQTIYRILGHVRVPLRMIWAQGINASGDTTISPTLTFAAALGAPLDPSEEGQVAVIFSGSNAIYDPSNGGVIVPDGTTPANAALLQASLAAAVVYPGNEAQLPDSRIVADKGANVTPAFRGLRYIVFPAFPLAISGGFPTNLSIVYQRTNDLGYTPAAVEFAAGAG